MDSDYTIDKCSTVIEDKENYLDLSKNDIKRSGIGDFHCPVGLVPNFVDGQQYSEKYTFTSIFINLCDIDAENSTCLFSSKDELAAFTSKLRIKFFFLNTNFDGSNI